MRLARARVGDRTVVGIVDGDLLRPLGAESFVPGLNPEREGVAAVLRQPGPTREAIRLGDCRLLAPVPRPGKILCAGANYRAHALEAGVKPPPFPEIFAKFGNTIIGPDDAIPAAGPDPSIDWEGELAVVIGQRAKAIPEESALSVVAGYTVANDISARTWQTRVSQWTTGKSFDGFCPVGPWMVTADEIPDPQRLRLRTLLNGDTVQDASTADMLFPVSTLIAYLSSVITLEPGDLILTGTPEGVGLHREPPRFLRAGDLIEVEVDGVGRLSNSMAG